MVRAPIDGGFKVLVVPTGDVRLTKRGLTIPMVMEQAGDFIRVVGNADKSGTGCSPWAFTKESRKTVCENLRSLADWIETQPNISSSEHSQIVYGKKPDVLLV